jgi:PIN domain nuclease of toxin-antitoxin system
LSASAYVLDSSALLAVLNHEAGENVVTPLLTGSYISSVNWAEVIQKAMAFGIGPDLNMRDELEAIGVTIVPFLPNDAEDTAAIWQLAPRAGLSLGDRACLALAAARDAIAVTSDRVWANLPLKVTVQVIR